MERNEYFNNPTYLVLEEDLVASVDVVVSASEDNTLSYLEYTPVYGLFKTDGN